MLGVYSRETTTWQMDNAAGSIVLSWLLEILRVGARKLAEGQGFRHKASSKGCISPHGGTSRLITGITGVHISRMRVRSIPI